MSCNRVPAFISPGMAAFSRFIYVRCHSERVIRLILHSIMLTQPAETKRHINKNQGDLRLKRLLSRMHDCFKKKHGFQLGIFHNILSNQGWRQGRARGGYSLLSEHASPRSEGGQLFCRRFLALTIP